MRKGRIPLVILCVIGMAGLLGLQIYWMHKYYYITRLNFEKEVNLAFEDAIKKEFSLRLDTVEQLMVKVMMDTNEFVITSKFKKGAYSYTTRNKENLNDNFTGSFSIGNLNIPIIVGDTINRKKVISTIAKSIRVTDLENNVIFFRTQNLGRYLTSKMDQYGFDTLRLKPVFDSLLIKRNIRVPYVLRFINNNRTVSKSNLPLALAKNYPVITKTLNTQHSVVKANFIAALFKNPLSYMVNNIAVIFISSLLMVALIAYCLVYLLNSLFKEKRLSAIKNDFISNITHEFKTPIATVSAAVEALTSFDVLHDSEKTRRYLGHAKMELSRLSELVDQVLNIAIYSGNDKSLIKEPSIKYSGEDVDITIRTVIKNNFLLICIQDAGIGLKEAELPLVFDQFYRSPDAILQKVKGYGLGLNYVKSIMENHNGWYKMESKTGQGSTVTLAWPI